MKKIVLFSKIQADMNRIIAALLVGVYIGMMNPLFTAYGESRGAGQDTLMAVTPPGGAGPAGTFYSGGEEPAAGGAGFEGGEAGEGEAAAVEEKSVWSGSALVSVEAGGEVYLGEAEIHIPAGALGEDTEIRITRLGETEETGEGLRNVTAGGGGYRFEPAGTVFLKPVRIRMGYEAGLNEGALEELDTYYYDIGKGEWERLERVGIAEGRVESETTHFTDMINGTLALPEGPKPLDVNINSIKGLEAANPNAGVIKLEGLEGNSDGAANFAFELELPGGRAGMTPRVAVTYSSGGGNGVMGRGFDLRYGGRITTDTRRGLPEYDDGLDEYMLDGVRLVLKGEASAGVREYGSERESGYDQIRRYYGGGNDYWVVTDRGGVERTYGKSERAWTGLGVTRKYRWELEEERDAYGNTVRYEYVKRENELYILNIYYTGYGADKGPYRVWFDYGWDREDVRVDGRGKFVQETKGLLGRIEVRYGDEYVRSYRVEYERKEETFFTSQVKSFGQEKGEGEGEYWWKYGFEYEGLKRGPYGYEVFGERETWNMPNGIQVRNGVSGGGSFMVGAGKGIAKLFPSTDLRVTGSVQGGMSAGVAQVKQTMVDINGDGRPDSVRRTASGFRVALNEGDHFGAEQDCDINIPGLGNSKNLLTTFGFSTFGGVGTILGGIGSNFSRTTQNGWDDTPVGFADIDGDGVADIVQEGNNWYYRNTSHETGRISFEGKQLYNTVPQIIRNNVQPVSEEDHEGYENTYYQQAPFRAWRSPYGGTVKVRQEVVIAVDDRGEEMSGDGLVVRTYRGEEEAAAQETVYTKETRPAVEDKEYALERGEALYFVGDALEDTRGDDVKWNIRIG
jgi:hypothetical protein